MKIPEFIDIDKILNPTLTTFNFRDLPQFKDGCAEIQSYLKETSKDATVGQLARTFPQHQRLLLDILETLKEQKEIYMEDHLPRPTVVHV